MSRAENPCALEEIQWVRLNGLPPLGAHLRSPRYEGIYYHVGIAVTSNYVVHFSGEPLHPENARVKLTEFARFAQDCPVEMARYPPKSCYPPETTVNLALIFAQLQYRHYDMLRNNCEHVAQFCKTGVWRSAQAEAVLHKVSAILGKVKRALPVHVPIVGPPLMEIAEVGRDAVSNFLGSLAVASNAPPLNLQCSFESIAPTGRAEDKRIVLMSYWCRTCWGPDSGALGCVCPVCALSCHDGHDIQLQPIMSYVCSCGQCAHRNLCTNVLLDAGCIPPRFVPSIPGAQTSLVPSHSLAPVSPSIPPIVATADSPATSVGTPPAATSFNAAPGVQRLYQCEACNAVLCFPCSRTCHAMHRMTDLGLVALDCSGSSSTPPLRCQCAEATATSGTRCRLARVNIDPPPPFAANILCSCGDVQTAAASAKASLTTDSDAAAAFAVAASTAAAVASQVMHGRSYTEPEVLCASGEDQETVHCDSAVPVGPNGQDLDGTGNLPLRGVSSLPN